MNGDLLSDIQHLGGVRSPFLVRVLLADLFAKYGADWVRLALIKQAADEGPNVLSIALANSWGRSPG
jgi:hypothetical protein